MEGKARSRTGALFDHLAKRRVFLTRTRLVSDEQLNANMVKELWGRRKSNGPRWPFTVSRSAQELASRCDAGAIRVLSARIHVLTTASWPFITPAMQCSSQAGKL